MGDVTTDRMRRWGIGDAAWIHDGDWRVVRNREELLDYQGALDDAGGGGVVPYRHDHNDYWPGDSGTPHYPAIVRSRWWDDPNGPYNYDHHFTTVAEVESMRAALAPDAVLRADGVVCTCFTSKTTGGSQ